MIPAAEFGTRFLPEIKAMPKEMLPIVDKPTIQYIVEEILDSGIDEILIVSGHAKRAIEDHFDSAPELEQHLFEHNKLELLDEVRKVAITKVHYIRQQHMRGLGDAILVPKILLMGNLLALFLGMTWCITEMIHRPWDSCLNNMKKLEVLLWAVRW